MRRLYWLLCGAFIVGIVGMVRGGNSSSHTVMIRIIRPIEMNIESKQGAVETVESSIEQNTESVDHSMASILRWKSDQTRKKVTVSVDQFSENDPIQIEGIRCMGGTAHQCFKVHPFAQDIITNMSTLQGECEVRTIIHSDYLSRLTDRIPRILYTITDSF